MGRDRTCSKARQRPATKASLPALFQAALVCPQRAPAKGVRRQQKGRKEALLPAHSFWLVLAVDKRVRPGPAREARLLWLAAPSGPVALLHIGLKHDVRHPAAAEQAANGLAVTELQR